MNKLQLEYMRHEFSKLRQETWCRMKKIATRKEAKTLSTDECWEILMRALDQKILPLSNNNCWTEYGKNQLLSYFD